MTLDDWAGHLRDHFGMLSAERARGSAAHLLFVLEHGIDAGELAGLISLVQREAADSGPRDAHFLPWVVYATEIGYQYAGDQYWQTYEADTPGWLEHGSRAWLRDAFARFDATYHGAAPSGPWAEHFSIIAWPITHAILPLDLQRQMAALLFRNRHALTRSLIEAPIELGEWIKSRAFDSSARFRNLAEQPAITGQIAAALLLGADRSGELIHPPTLRRISADLDRERRSRDWLKDARRHALGRVSVRGAVRRRTEERTSPSNRAGTPTRVDVRPSLVLRPGMATGMAGELFLQIPPLAPLLGKFPEFDEAIAKRRCVLAVSSGRPRPGEWLLHGGDPVRLSRWPNSEPLLTWEPPSVEAQRVLDDECPAPRLPALLRLATDGLGYQVRSTRLQPGRRYVLLTAEAVANGPIGAAVAVSCTGVFALRLDVPLAPGRDVDAWLSAIGLSRARTLEVWPAGTCAASWDGAGSAQWLTSERPCVGIATDHDLASLTARLDPGEDWTQLTRVVAGEFVFLEFPQLPVGSYRLLLRAELSADATADPVEAELSFQLRDATSWEPGRSPTLPLVLLVDPREPSLEQLWQGQLDLEVRGPHGRSADVTFKLFDRRGGVALVEKSLPPMALPISSAAWRGYFERSIRKAKEVEASYEMARAAELRFDARELGSARLICERDFTPLRWVVRRVEGARRVTLLDDSGGSAPLVTARYAFDHPDVRLPLGGQGIAPREQRIPAEGGLIYAARGDASAGLVIGPTALGLRPVVAEGRDETEAALEMINAIVRWANARLSSEVLAGAGRDAAVSALTRALFGVLGGSHWMSLEAALENGKAKLDELKRAVSTKKAERGFAAALSLHVPEFAPETIAFQAERLTALCGTFLHLAAEPVVEQLPAGVTLLRRLVDDPADPRWLCEFALRLATNPGQAQAWAGRSVAPGLEYLNRFPTIARAARFLALALQRETTTRLASRPRGSG
jgi:hypothetical protein